MISFRYTDKEINELMKTMTIICDTRESVNGHVLDYMKSKKIPVKIQTMKTGDYSAFLPANTELGIHRDIYLKSCLERKNSIDEITGNLQSKTRTTFENELIRAAPYPFVLVCEDANGYDAILNGRYRSKYDPKALLGTLKTFEARYNFSIVYLDKKYTGNYIYHHFYYQMREHLKNGMF